MSEATACPLHFPIQICCNFSRSRCKLGCIFPRTAADGRPSVVGRRSSVGAVGTPAGLVRPLPSGIGTDGRPAPRAEAAERRRSAVDASATRPASDGSDRIRSDRLRSVPIRIGSDRLESTRGDSIGPTVSRLRAWFDSIRLHLTRVDSISSIIRHQMNFKKST